MRKLVILRHGESEWNKQNRFTGWTDVELSEKGLQEAEKAGETLKNEGYEFDVVFTNVLKRCIKTTWIALDKLNMMWLPVHKAWQLNERHYGNLTGLNKAEMAKKFGEEQVLRWRRSYDTPPPEMEKSHEFDPANDRRYEGITVPRTECLKDTVERIIPYWESDIAPAIRGGKRVLISASGNSSRAIVKILEDMPNDEIVHFNIPTGIPLVYELDDKLKVLKRYFIGDPEEVKRAMQAVADQGKAKN